MLVFAFFLFFLLSIIYVRMDFSIAVDEGAEAKMKVAGYCEKVAGLRRYQLPEHAQEDHQRPEG